MSNTEQKDEYVPPYALKYPLSDWEYAVQNGDTRLGYADWVAHNIDMNGDERFSMCPIHELSKDGYAMVEAHCAINDDRDWSSDNALAVFAVDLKGETYSQVKGAPVVLVPAEVLELFHVAQQAGK